MLLPWQVPREIMRGLWGKSGKTSSIHQCPARDLAAPPQQWEGESPEQSLAPVGHKMKYKILRNKFQLFNPHEIKASPFRFIGHTEAYNAF